MTDLHTPGPLPEKPSEPLAERPAGQSPSPEPEQEPEPIRAESAPHVLLETRELSVTGAEPLSQISLQIKSGDILTVLGRAGAGGETLRDVLAGLIPKRAIGGAVIFGSDKQENHPRLAYLAGASQRPLVPYVGTASQLARILAKKLGIPRSSAHEELSLALGKLHGAPDIERLKQPPRDLTTYEIGVALLALALAQNADGILAADPAADLDPIEAEKLFDLLLTEHKRKGFALIYFTGDPATALRLDGRIIVLKDGKLIEDGSSGRLSSTHAHAYTQSLFKAMPQLSETAPSPAHVPRTEPLLQVRGFSFEKSKSRKAEIQRRSEAVGLTFDLGRGGSLALIGERGSGRKAIVKALLGLEPAPQGRVVFDSVDLGVLSPTMLSRLHRRIAFISGDDSVLDPRMTARETVIEPMRSAINLGNEENFRAARAVFKRMGLAEPLEQRRSTDLSPLDRRRLQIARALAAVPQLVVLYEPLAGLDALAAALVLDLLKEFKLREGTAFLLVTANFAIAQALCLDALIVRDKKVVERGTIADILRAPQDAHTMALIAAASRRVGSTRPSLSPAPSEG